MFMLSDSSKVPPSSRGREIESLRVCICVRLEMEPLVSCMPGKCFTSDFHIKAFVSAFYLEVGSHLHRLVLSLLCSSTGLELSSE